LINRPYDAFWGEMSAFEHFVQIYEKETSFLDTLANFVGDGLSKGEGVIVILTEMHRQELKIRLRTMEYNLETAEAQDQLILLDADETLNKFMVDDWPDEAAFAKVITDTLKRASGTGRTVRAFGEMVALMWARGQCGATVRLEHLWHELCQRESLPLFCAYPKSGFTEDPASSIAHVCSLHSKTIAA
jgi:hypothetical protein